METRLSGARRTATSRHENKGKRYTSDTFVVQAIGAALRSPAFGPRTVDAVAACAAAHRQATLQLLAASYATISVADVAQALALSEADALAGT